MRLLLSSAGRFLTDTRRKKLLILSKELGVTEAAKTIQNVKKACQSGTFFRARLNWHIHDVKWNISSNLHAFRRSSLLMFPPHLHPLTGLSCLSWTRTSVIDRQMLCNVVEVAATFNNVPWEMVRCLFTSWTVSYTFVHTHLELRVSPGRQGLSAI